MVSIFYNKFCTFRVAFEQPLNDGCKSYKKRLCEDYNAKVACTSTLSQNFAQRALVYLVSAESNFYSTRAH